MPLPVSGTVFEILVHLLLTGEGLKKSQLCTAKHYSTFKNLGIL
jgi:hypothetical protein